jgi:hypothetical protein
VIRSNYESEMSAITERMPGAKRGRKPKPFEIYQRESLIRIRDFKAKAKDLTLCVAERKRWRSCASALKTRLALRQKEK